MTIPNSSTVLLRRADGAILMQLRDDGLGRSIPYPNTWNFPGGAIEPGESPLDAAIREIEEEFGIRLEPAACREIWSYSHEHAPSDHVFLCNVPDDTEPPVQREGAAFAWMTLEQIGKLELGFDQARILPQIPLR